MQNRIPSGYVIALGASVALLISVAILVVTFLIVLGLISVNSFTPQEIATRTPLGVFLALGWLGAIAGLAGSFVAIAVYGFRARWFWNCLMATSALLLVAPPLGTIVGALALVVLFRFRRHFPNTGEMPATPAL